MIKRIPNEYCTFFKRPFLILPYYTTDLRFYGKLLSLFLKKNEGSEKIFALMELIEASLWYNQKEMHFTLNFVNVIKSFSSKWFNTFSCPSKKMRLHFLDLHLQIFWNSSIYLRWSSRDWRYFVPLMLLERSLSKTTRLNLLVSPHE